MQNLSEKIEYELYFQIKRFLDSEITTRINVGLNIRVNDELNLIKNKIHDVQFLIELYDLMLK